MLLFGFLFVFDKFKLLIEKLENIFDGFIIFDRAIYIDDLIMFVYWKNCAYTLINSRNDYLLVCFLFAYRDATKMAVRCRSPPINATFYEFALIGGFLMDKSKLIFDKDNPYIPIFDEIKNKYLIYFKDLERTIHEIEVSKAIYLEFVKYNLLLKRQ